MVNVSLLISYGAAVSAVCTANVNRAKIVALLNMYFFPTPFIGILVLMFYFVYAY